MKLLHILLISCSGSGLVVVADGEECTEEKIDNCYEVLSDNPDLPDDTDDALIAAHNTFCNDNDGSLQNYQKCLKPFLSNCEDFDKAIPSGYVRAHRYLCDVDIEVYLIYHKCIENVFSGECHDGNNIPNFDGEGWTEKECSAFESYLTCEHDTVNEVCSETVATVSSCFLRLLYADYAEYAGCEITLDRCEISAVTTPKEENGENMLSVATSTLMLSLVSVILVF